MLCQLSAQKIKLVGLSVVGFLFGWLSSDDIGWCSYFMRLLLLVANFCELKPGLMVDFLPFISQTFKLLNLSLSLPNC